MRHPITTEEEYTRKISTRDKHGFRRKIVTQKKRPTIKRSERMVCVDKEMLPPIRWVHENKNYTLKTSSV